MFINKQQQRIDNNFSELPYNESIKMIIMINNRQNTSKQTTNKTQTNKQQTNINKQTNKQT